MGDVMAESRGGREDRRLKASYSRLWSQGTEFVEAELFDKYLTSKQLKVKPKANNIAGLQIADLIAHPSRNEILDAEDQLGRQLPEFARLIIAILQDKYDCEGERVYGKKFL